MTDQIPMKRPGRPANPIGTFRKTNVFKQLMYAKNDLALKLVESCQDHWESITGVLMGKALEGDMRAMALLLDYVIEKAPQKFQINTSGVDISNMGLDDMMKLVVTYDSMMQDKKKTIMGEAEEIESHLINSPPPPPDIEVLPDPQFPVTETPDALTFVTLSQLEEIEPE